MPKAPEPAQMVWALPHDALRGPRGTLYVGGAVEAELLLIERDDIVVAARHFTAYPDGFAFVLHIWLSEPENNLFELTDTLAHNPRRGGKHDRKHVDMRVELPNGTVVRSSHDGMHVDDPCLELYHHWVLDDHYEGELVARVAAPPSGSVTLVLDWAARGIVEARASIDAALLSDAARHARPLFAVADRPQPHPWRDG